jgi:hypothetical protein
MIIDTFVVCAVIRIMIKTNTTLTFEDFKTEVLNDYRIAISRECSLLGRREVLTGRRSSESLEMERSASISNG